MNLGEPFKCVSTGMLIGVMALFGMPRQTVAYATMVPEPEAPTTAVSAAFVTSMAGVAIADAPAEVQQEIGNLIRLNEMVGMLLWGEFGHGAMNYKVVQSGSDGWAHKLSNYAGETVAMTVLLAGPDLTTDEQGLPLPAQGKATSVIALLDGELGSIGVEGSLVTFTHDSGEVITTLMLDGLADSETVDFLDEYPEIGQAASYLSQTRTEAQLTAMTSSTLEQVKTHLPTKLVEKIAERILEDSGTPLSRCLAAAFAPYLVKAAACMAAKAACSKLAKIAFLRIALVCKKAALFTPLLFIPGTTFGVVLCYLAAAAALLLATKLCKNTFNNCMRATLGDLLAGLAACGLYFVDAKPSADGSIATS